jgi:hypothetical protein
MLSASQVSVFDWQCEQHNGMPWPVMLRNISLKYMAGIDAGGGSSPGVGMCEE